MGDELGDGGIGRRELLKRGAVAGGLVWASPMVFSATAGAQSATVGDCPDCPTDRFYGLKFNNGPDDESGNTCPGLPGEPVPGEDECTEDPVTGGTGCFESLPSGGGGSGNCLQSSTEVPPGCLEPYFDFIGSCDGKTHTWVLQPSLQLCQAAAKVGVGSPNYTGDNQGCLVCPTSDPEDITVTCDGAPIDVSITGGVTTVTITDPALSHSEILFCYKGSPLSCLEV